MYLPYPFLRQTDSGECQSGRQNQCGSSNNLHMRRTPTRCHILVRTAEQYRRVPVRYRENAFPSEISNHSRRQSTDGGVPECTKGHVKREAVSRPRSEPRISHIKERQPSHHDI